MKAIVLIVLFALGSAQDFNFTKYDPKKSHELFLYSAASYCPNLQLVSWNCGTPCSEENRLTQIQTFTYKLPMEKELSGFMGIRKDLTQIVLAFKGTNAPQLMTFFKFEKVPFLLVQNGVVHDGFYNAFLDTREKVQVQVRQLLELNQTADIVITGHGLGAALSTLHALDIAQTFNISSDRFTIYNFGCPRIGDSAFAIFADSLLKNSSYFRVTSQADIVTQLPRQIQGFEHAGIEVWYSQLDQNYKTCQQSPDVREDPACIQGQRFNLNMKFHPFYLQQEVSGLCIPEGEL